MAAESPVVRDVYSEHRNFFRSLDREGIARWLWTGLSTLYTPGSYAGFVPLEFWMGRLDSPLDDLGYIYKELVPTDQQPLFRQAIGDILEARKNDEETPVDAIDDLLCLADEVGAAEAVGAIAHTVGSGLVAKEAKHLLYDGIGVLKSFPPSPDLREAMLELVDSANFNNRFIFDVANFLSRKGLVLAGDEAIPKLTARMDALYREAQALGEKAVAEVKEEAAKLSWYWIPEG